MEHRGRGARYILPCNNKSSRELSFRAPHTDHELYTTMSYRIIPAEFPDLPLPIPALTAIAVSLLFVGYLLTLMPRRSKFVVNGRVRGSRLAELSVLMFLTDSPHHRRFAGYGKGPCKTRRKERCQRSNRCTRRQEARSSTGRDQGPTTQ